MLTEYQSIRRMHEIILEMRVRFGSDSRVARSMERGLNNILKLNAKGSTELREQLNSYVESQEAIRMMIDSIVADHQNKRNRHV